jgi:hypothetical protein
LPAFSCGRFVTAAHRRLFASGVGTGKRGHRSVNVSETGAAGRFLCFRQNEWASIEWTDTTVDVYSIAYGRDLIRLRRWWESRARPIQRD